MDTFFTISHLLLLIIILITPVIVFKTLKNWNSKLRFFLFIILSFLITTTLAILAGWWGDKSNMILLEHYGAKTEWNISFENVKSEDLERVKQLEISVMGIGWPLKVIMGLVGYSPFLLIYCIAYNNISSKNEKSMCEEFKTENHS